MIDKQSLKTIFLIWLGWGIIILGFQTLVDNRYQPDRPDYAVEWSSTETERTSQNDKPYLIEPFMNRQVAWDSEYYLSIAAVGYEDPVSRAFTTRAGRKVSLNHAFFPLYPFVMRGVSFPLQILGMNPIATATLAGVLVSLAGTLGGMIALYDLTREKLGEDGGIRTAFYFLIFPTSFFLAQVYTEGLFAGLAFGSLMLLRRKYFFWAAVLAALATWTRSIGIALVIPLGLIWFNEVRQRGVSPINWKLLASGVLVLLPLGAYLVWSQLLGRQFGIVQDGWFGRGLLNLDAFGYGVDTAFKAIVSGENLQMRIYFLLEFAAVVLAFAACLFTLRTYPVIALFSLAALVFSVTSGSPQSLIRYVLMLPALFIFLSRLGRNQAFDRVWTVASILLLAMQVSLFTYDMWVA